MEQHDNLKAVRKELGLTQSEFAQKLKIKQSYYSALERGEKPFSGNIINKLIKEIGVSADWLYSSKGALFSNSNIDINLGNRVKQLRDHLNLTQIDFANKINISRSMLSLIETDKTIPTYETLKKICSVFGLLPSFFFEDHEINDVGIYLKAGEIIEKRKVESKRVSDNYDANFKAQYGEGLKNRLKFELLKGNANLYNIYDIFDTTPSLLNFAQALLNFLQDLDFEDPAQITNYIDSFLTSSQNTPVSYEQYKKMMISYLEHLQPYYGKFLELKEFLQAFFIQVKPLDRDGNLWMV